MSKQHAQCNDNSACQQSKSILITPLSRLYNMLITYAILIRDCIIWLFVISRVTQRIAATVRLVKVQETDTITLLATFSWFLMRLLLFPG